MTEGERVDAEEQLNAAIAQLEAQRAILGDAVVDAMIAAARRELAALQQSWRNLGLRAPEDTETPAPTMAGERKLVTVVFADVSGFTALAEAMDPEAVRDLMNACFERLVPLIGKYEGTIDKFIGDSVMVLFGAPVTHENDPERALRAALEMQEALAAFNEEHGIDLGMHIGINTGLVIAGGIGPRGRQEYSVMGDAVNLASRLEEASELGQILVGPDTYRLAGPVFEFEELEPLRVKGKAEPVPIYRLLAARAVPDKMRGIAGLESPLVGRRAELGALQEAIQKLQVGEGGIVTLLGEAGLGKSRLVAELRKDVPWEHLSWVEGRCLSYGGSIAYLLWVDLLRGLLGVATEDSFQAVMDALRERVRLVCPERFEEVYPYLGRLLSVPLEAEHEAVLWDQEGEQLKAATFRAVEVLLECAAGQRPQVIVCEDLHWADPTSVELLERLLPLTARVPLLFICVSRPERNHHSWRVREGAIGFHRRRHTDLWLAPLSDVESEALVGNLLYVEDLPRQLRRRILLHAEGNPFYVEEIIRSLMDSGDIVRDETSDRWMATRDVADIAIPDTLHGVLVARIDRLQEETKRVLQLAAVIGRVFLYRLLAAMAAAGTVATVPADEEREFAGEFAGESAGEPEGRLTDPVLWGHLRTLQQEEMIRERSRMPELEYIFKHHLTQEAAYNGLLKRDRRIFHRHVAEALERLFPERIEEQVGLLAYHWERAEDAEKATEYLLRVGDQARMFYAHQEAIDAYQRALTFLREQEDQGQAARTLLKLGLTYHTAFDFQRSRQAYEEGFALWQRAGEAQPETSLAPHALRTWRPNPTTLDPTMTNEYFSAGLVNQLFSGLVELSAEMNVVPDVACSWEILEDGCKFVFRLRDDVRWSDGTPLTAGDFEYAWKQVLDPAVGSPNASMLYDIQGARAFHQGEVSDPDSVGVRALDEVTLVVELEEPTGYFFHLLTYFGCYPLPRHVVEAFGQAWTEVGNMVTNGPFRLAAWQEGQSMVLSRNPTYHGQFGGNLERVELSLDPLTAAAKLERYRAGDLDILNLFGLPRQEIDRARQEHAGEYISCPNLLTEYVGFTVTCPPFDDLRVRRAFALAIDKETLAGVVMRGYVSPAMGGFVPPGMPGYSADIGLLHDPERARRLLTEAGYPGGQCFPALEARFSLNTDMEHYAGYLREQWRENLGIEITWKSMNWGPYIDLLRRDPPHLFLMAWLADYPDPDNFLRVGLWREMTGWWNRNYEEWVEGARRVTDQGERLELSRLADKILMEEAAIVPLFYGRLHLLVKPWVSKYPPAAIGGPFWKEVIIKS